MVRRTQGHPAAQTTSVLPCSPPVYMAVQAVFQYPTLPTATNAPPILSAISVMFWK
ncbi:hypothetical protein C8T65DRAFT_663059 [Cerioporus squamosus]|nr:hypothetical protein C8T65DRAFT_663059 [Cerioporus squamosus]